MALEIANLFSSFCSKLKINDSAKETMQQRYYQITKRLNIEFYGSISETLHTFYAGSHGRGTDIYTSDIDIVAVLPNEVYWKYDSYQNNGQSALLQEVKNALKKTYSSSDISGDGQVIVIQFSDGMKFEIVPAFLNRDGQSYTYPDSNNGGSWRVMHPKEEISAFNIMNDKCNGNLKELCKMVREWNSINNVLMPGVLIDVTCYKFIENYEYNQKSFLYYDYMTRDYFKYLYENADQSYWCMPNSNWHVSKKYTFKSDAKKAYELALKAIEDSNKGLDWSATNEWKEIYGTKF